MATRRFTQSCMRQGSSSSTSAARCFLQLASRRSVHTTPPPLFDFLAPSIPRSAIPRLYARRNVEVRGMPRSFSSSSLWRTKAIVNPKQDDDGKDMLVEITPRASNRLKQIMAKDDNPDLALRIQVESGGCHGFQYLMSLITLPPLSSVEGQEEASPALNTSSADPNASPATENTPALDEEDTVFAAEDGSGAKIVMDGPSLELLQGSKVDYTMELIGSQFKIVDNPLATSSCGCGTSFDIKA
ncbi:Iron-sulfur cluster assembly 2-like protein, mitochondrial [Phlyctema vagabunda]|uniref:Iron-sulfur cluster assembly 2-like protein, mitochondrial n=1 Tax=Phlyctema vagabunda TaxID=108571 RepID=A0ABR4PQH7_9HELO